MKFRPEDCGLRTWAVLIGVNEYQNRKRNLEAPARDVIQLEQALVGKRGCGVPERQVSRLPTANLRVTKGEGESVIRTAAESAGPLDFLLIYFAGHGEHTDAGFQLCFSDEALTGGELETLLAPTRARGVLVVLDCCESAGFAESAPRFFLAQPSGCEFRILLSASRADKPSWEFPEEGTLFTRHLIATLQGREISSQPAGVIRFTGLLNHLTDRIAEDLDRYHPGAELQEPAFAGWYIRDPLLFVQPNIAPKGLLETSAFSRSYVRARIRLVLVALAASLVFIAGSYCAVLSQLRYVAVGADGIATFKGHPHWRAPGLPAPVWSLEFGHDALLDTSPARIPGGAVTVPMGESPIQTLENQLRPEYRSLFKYWQGDEAAARRVLRGFFTSADWEFSDRAGSATGLLATIADKDDQNLLSALATNGRLDVSHAAVLGLARLDRNRGLDAARSLVGADAGFGGEILESLNGPCDSNVVDYLDSRLRAKNQVEIKYVLDAALRLNCALSFPAEVSAIVRAVSRDDARAIAAYASLSSRSDFESHLRLLLAAARSHPLSPREADGIGSLVDSSAGMLPQHCVQEVLELRHHPDAALAGRAYAAALETCPNERKNLRSEIQANLSLARSALVTGELASSSPDGRALSILLEKHDFANLLSAIAKLAQAKQSIPADLCGPLLAASDSAVVEQTMIALRLQGAAATSAPRFFHNLSSEVQKASYEWYLSKYRRQAFTAILDRLGDQTATYLPELFSTTVLSTTETQELLNRLNGSPAERKHAAGILTVAGDAETVLELLMSPSSSVRVEAESYAGARADCAKLLARLVAASRARGTKLPVFVSALATQTREIEKIEAALQGLPVWARPWRAELLAQTRYRVAEEGITLYLLRHRPSPRGPNWF